MIIDQYIQVLSDILYEAVRPRVTPTNVENLYKKYIYVDSSNVHSMWYDPEEQLLRVRFLSGAEYEYYRVPERIFIALLNANSHGSKFWKLVRNTFRYDRLADFDVEQASTENPEY